MFGKKPNANIPRIPTPAEIYTGISPGERAPVSSTKGAPGIIGSPVEVAVAFNELPRAIGPTAVFSSMGQDTLADHSLPHYSEATVINFALDSRTMDSLPEYDKTDGRTYWWRKDAKRDIDEGEIVFPKGYEDKGEEVKRWRLPPLKDLVIQSTSFSGAASGGVGTTLATDVAETIGGNIFLSTTTGAAFGVGALIIVWSKLYDRKRESLANDLQAIRKRAADPTQGALAFPNQLQRFTLDKGESGEGLFSSVQDFADTKEEDKARPPQTLEAVTHAVTRRLVVDVNPAKLVVHALGSLKNTSDLRDSGLDELLPDFSRTCQEVFETEAAITHQRALAEYTKVSTAKEVKLYEVALQRAQLALARQAVDIFAASNAMYNDTAPVYPHRVLAEIATEVPASEEVLSGFLYLQNLVANSLPANASPEKLAAVKEYLRGAVELAKTPDDLIQIYRGLRANIALDLPTTPEIEIILRSKMQTE